MTMTTAKKMDIPVDMIKPSPYQPRLSFGLEDIKGSIIRDGILVALTVRKKAGAYELVDGERRLRIAKELGYATIPCNVIDVDDNTARRMVWKVNVLRRDYEPREKALFFKKMKEEYGISFKSIANDFDIDHRDVKAYLNVFKMPKEYQQMVWDRVIPIRNIRELDQLFNRVVRATPEENPEIFELIERSVKERHFGAEQIREALKPYLTKLREGQIERAKEALVEVKPELETPETPEELEEAAEILKREARRRKPPEEILEDKRSRARKTRDNIIRLIEKSRAYISTNKYQKRIEDLDTIIEKKPGKIISELKVLKKQLQSDVKGVREEMSRQKLEEEIKRKFEEKTRKSVEERVQVQRRKIEEEAKVRAKEELMKDQEFLRHAAEVTQEERTRKDWRGKEIPAKGPDKEIVTEDMWECPICRVRHRLIHLEPRGHRLEEIRGD